MPDAWSTRLSSVRPVALIVFLSALAALTFLVYAPALLLGRPISPYFPLSVEILVVAGAVVYAADTKASPWVRLLGAVVLFFFLVYETYDALIYIGFDRHGILYEDIQYAVNGLYFAMGLITWEVLAGLLIGLPLLFGVGWIVVRLFRLVEVSGRDPLTRLLLFASHAVAWPLVLVVGPAQEWGTENMTYKRAVDVEQTRTVAEKLAANAQASAALWREMHTLGEEAPVDSTYHQYDRLALDRRPDVQLLTIESYGEVLASHSELRGPFQHLLEETESSLDDAGWHMATIYSDAPISGGRSWLGISTTLAGTEIDNQLIYERFLGRESYPNMTQFFRNQGYETIKLQPAVHERPGLPVSDPYGFDTPLYMDDLEYEGPDYGWGTVPDQYSLYFTHENHIAPSNQPTFLFFHAVAAHALWNYGIPPYIDDWRAFNTAEGDSPRRALAQRAEPDPGLLPDSLTSPIIYGQDIEIRYLRHVTYNMRLFRDYLRDDAPDGSLAIIFGDHQPPIIEGESMGTPIHVLSTDEELIERFRAHGFAPGLNVMPEELNDRITHAGLYSLLVRVLSEHNDLPDDELPPLRPDGIPRSILAQ